MSGPAAAALLLPLLVTLPFGRTPFAIAVGLVALAVLIDLAGVLGDSMTRPIVLAALLPVVGVPAAAAAGDDGWTAVPAALAIAFLLTVALVLALGRRRQVTEVVGGTVLAALLPTLGAGGLVMLQALPEGLTWVLAVLGLCAAADIGGPAARVVERRRAVEEGMPPPPRGASLVPLAGAALMVLVALGLISLVAPGGVSRSALAGIGLLAFAGSRAGRETIRRLAAEAGRDLGYGMRSLGDGVLVLAASTTLLTAPAAYVIASATV